MAEWKQNRCEHGGKMNTLTVKKQNLEMLISLLRIYGVCTQSELKEKSNLQASTVSYLIRDLKEGGLVLDYGVDVIQGRRGKPGSKIGFNTGEINFLGLYVEDNFIDSYRIAIDGSTTKQWQVPFHQNDVRRAIIHTVREEVDADPTIKGIGIAIKGIVKNDGRIVSGVRYDDTKEAKSWNFSALAPDLRRLYPGIPIVVENDANCAAELYEYSNRQSDEHGSFIVYLINDKPFGIGCGLMLDGRLYRGYSGAAGEVKGELKNHIEICTSMLDVQKVVLAGSMIQSLSQQDREKFVEQLKNLPCSVELAYGEKQLNPANGAALIVINSYLSGYVDEVLKQ